MKRIFWVVAGVTVGVLLTRKASKTAARFTPGGVADRIATLGEVFREFADDVRDAMAEREYELRDALGIQTGPEIETLGRTH